MATVIRGGTVVTETTQFQADVCIEDQRISAVGQGLTRRGDTAVDAAGDLGFTLAAALDDWQRRATPQALCDYSFHMGIIDPRPEVLAVGVCSFKLYLAYKGKLMVDDGQAFRIMREAGRLGAWTLVHAENGDLIEALAADARAAGRLSAAMHAATRPPAGEAGCGARRRPGRAGPPARPAGAGSWPESRRSRHHMPRGA